MTKIRFIFNRVNRKITDNEKALLQLQVYFGRRKSIYKKLFHLSRSQWDDKNKQVTAAAPNHLYLNNRLNILRKKYYDLCLELDNRSEMLTPEVFKSWYDREILLLPDSARPATINIFIDREKDKILSVGNVTRSHYSNTLKLLNEFNPAIKFKDLNYSLVSDWNNFLILKGYKINTIFKHHKVLKTFINLAIKKGNFSYDQYPYRNYRVKTEATSRVDLDFIELERLENLSYPNNPSLQESLDMFLFGCYSGLRFSNIRNIETRHLIRTKDGVCLDLDKVIKVRRPVYIPLELLFEGKSVLIIKKFLSPEQFDNIGFKQESRKIFNHQSNPTINKNLKTIQHDADINKLLTFHVSRHTFGTNLAEVSEGDIYLVMDLMGISKVETAMIYIHNSKERTHRKLRKINWNPHIIYKKNNG